VQTCALPIYFRLDIVDGDASDDALAAALVRDMRLLMVRTVRIRNKRIIEEAHKRGAAAAPAAAGDGGPRLVDLSHRIEHGMVTYKGLPAPLVCDHLSRAASRGLYSEGTEYQI